MGASTVQFVYTIPNGSNPSGGSLTEARKRAIYALAQKHNLLILEDGTLAWAGAGAGAGAEAERGRSGAGPGQGGMSGHVGPSLASLSSSF